MARAKATYDLVAQDKSKKAFSSIKKNLGGLKTAFGALGLALGAAGFARFITGALKAGDEVQKLAIQTGASTEFLSEMRGVLELSGVSYNAFIKSMQKGNKAVLDASLGLKTQSEAFARLGLNVQELVALSPEEQFMAIGTAIASIENPTERSAAQMELLGARSTELLRFFANSPEAIAAMRAEQVKFGNSLSRDMVDKMADANDAMSRLGQQMSGLGSRFAVEFADPIVEGASALSDILIPVLKFAGNIFGALGDIIGATGAALVAFFSGNFSEAASIASLALDDLVGRFNAVEDAQTKAGLAPTAGGGPAPAVAALAGPQSGVISDRTGENKDPQLKDTNATLKEIARNTAGPRFAIAG